MFLKVKMKKIISIGFVGLLFLGLMACRANNLEDLTSLDWQGEFVSDLEGRPLDLDAHIEFENGEKFIFKEEASSKEIKGTYRLEDLASSYKLNLIFPGSKEPILASYGSREYEDGKELKSISFQYNNKIYSFIAKE